MIITRAPLRVSFAGGGTDIPAFYEKYGPGMVVSTAITRYVYVTLGRKFDGKVSVRYRNHELTDSVQELKHVLIREALLHYGVKDNVELVIASEVPAKGSGLGASSAMILALCLALEILTGRKSEIWEASNSWNKKKLAEIAAHIEIVRCGSPIGKQDQYASAMGGLNRLTFNADGTVGVDRHPHDEFVQELEAQSMLFYLNIEHTYDHPTTGRPTVDKMFAPRILYDQLAQMDQKSKVHLLQRDNARELWEHLTGYGVMERFQDHVNENWRLKRTVHHDISSDAIDRIIQKAYDAGATAAKVCGAGGGGFVYLIVPPSMQEDVRKAMAGFHELRFKFNQKGVECLFAEGDHA